MTFNTPNVKHLVPFLESEAIPHEVIQDGWRVSIPYENVQAIFDLGRLFADYLANVKVDRSYDIALLKDNQDNYDKGLITKQEYEDYIKKLKP